MSEETNVTELAEKIIAEEKAAVSVPIEKAAAYLLIKNNQTSPILKPGSCDVPLPSPSSQSEIKKRRADENGNYIVQSGETLGEISNDFNKSVDWLCETNGIVDRHTIRVGQKLRVVNANEKVSQERSWYEALGEQLVVYGGKVAESVGEAVSFMGSSVANVFEAVISEISDESSATNSAGLNKLLKTLTDDQLKMIAGTIFAEASNNKAEAIYMVFVILNRVVNKYGGKTTVEGVLGKGIYGYKSTQYNKYMDSLKGGTDERNLYALMKNIKSGSITDPTKDENMWGGHRLDLRAEKLVPFIRKNGTRGLKYTLELILN